MASSTTSRHQCLYRQAAHPPPMKVCSEPGCPVLTPGRRCPEHERRTDRARGTRTERGYGREHETLRAQWAPLVATGLVACHRPGCPYLIPAEAPWDLGHDDTDRTRYHGPEHRSCNRAGRPSWQPPGRTPRTPNLGAR